jgi:hypothetical protein
MRPPALGKLDECGADLFRAFLPQRPLSFVRESRVSNAVTTQRGGQRARRASPLQNRLAIRSIRALTPSSSVAANQAPVAERPVALPPAWQWERILKNLILFLAIVCGGATVLSFMEATHAAVAASWTSQVCKAASPLCDSPVILGLATAGLASLWISAALFSAITNG